MSTLYRSVSVFLSAAAGIVLLFGHGVALGQPAQKPLMSRDGGGVPPNIMLTVDDSGSMMFQHMPENTVYVDSYSVSSPIGGNSVSFHPSDSQVLNSHFAGTIAAMPGTSNWRQKLMRSPDTNTIYYNPDVRYDPWMTANGTRMEASPVTAAYLDAKDLAGGDAVDLTATGGINGTWCFRGTRNGCDGTQNWSNRVFDPGLYFRLKKDGNGKYLNPADAANYTEYSINTPPVNGFPRTAGRTDCLSVAGYCTQAEERQNFANWFTYYRTRNFLAIGSVAEAFHGLTNNFRLGWGRINQGTDHAIDGVNTKVIEAGVREFGSTTKNNFYSWLFSLPANGGTPLPRAMDAVGTYYKRADNKGPWSDVPGAANSTPDKTCRRAYQIMVTDGYWNYNPNTAGNSDATDGVTITGPGRAYKYIATKPYSDGNSNMLADYAMKYWKQDLRTDIDNKVAPTSDDPAFWQHMVNITVGLGVRGTLNPDTDLGPLTAGTKVWGGDEIDDLWHAALNSRGDFLSAKDPKELSVALKGAVGAVLQRELQEAGVATASATLQDGNRKYVPQYVTTDWVGDVAAYQLDLSGQAGAKVWTASEKIPSAADRNIWTLSADANQGVVFRYESLPGANRAALGVSNTTEASALVEFLRGDRSQEGDGKYFRVRRSAASDTLRNKPVLGDFVNSNPVLVKDGLSMGYTGLASGDGGSSYGAFLTTKAGRPATLFVGANDGMLHAFRDTLSSPAAAEDGREIFAYVPLAVYSTLKELGNKLYGTNSVPHRYFIDGMVAEHDAYVKAPGASTPTWRNLLLGTLGAGGRAVFALDVTDTANLGANTVKWEVSGAQNGDIGYVASAPQVGVLPNGEWVAIFGNGRFSTNNKAVLFVVNINTGALRSLVVDGDGGNGLGGVTVLRNSDGYISSVYAGDMKGNLWKFNYSNSADSKFVVSDDGKPMFRALTESLVSQPITQPPALLKFSQGGYLVVLGTGALSTESEANSTAVQTIYTVWDKPEDTVARTMQAWPVPNVQTQELFASRTLTQLTGASVSAGVYFGSTGNAVNWTTQRGWKMDLTGVNMDGLRMIYPPQRFLNTNYVLLSAVAPARNVVVCESASGSGINFFIDVTDGRTPALSDSYVTFDTNGDGLINGSDALVAGQKTDADGIDAIVTGSVTQDANHDVRRVCLQNTKGQSCGEHRQTRGGVGVRQVKDRVWRRIINPPLR